MARIRTIKPDIARHRELFEMEKESTIPFRFIWALFPTVCDREGRFRWRPWEIKLDIIPYDDDYDFSRVMDALSTRGFLVKYANAGIEYGAIPTFSKHQVINNKEKPSEIPGYLTEGSSIINISAPLPTRDSRVVDACQSSLGKDQGEGKGRERKGRGKEGEGKGKELLAARPELNSAIWEAYREAYASRYNSDPVRNPKVNSAIAQIGKRLGDEAPAVVRFYLTHNKSFYVSKLHDIGLCLSDAEALRTQWFNDQMITEKRARDLDSDSALDNQIQRIREGRV